MGVLNLPVKDVHHYKDQIKFLSKGASFIYLCLIE